MKTSPLIMMALASLGVASCQTKVSVVPNRDASGRYITPTCPQDGQQFEDSATVYVHTGSDGKKHYGVSTWNEGSSKEAPTLNAVK